MSKIILDKISTRPVTVWLGRLPHDGGWLQPSFDSIEMLLLADRDLIGCSFRGVSHDRLDCVLRSGIDVVPPDSTIYVDDFEKAWEYGGWPKVMLALDTERLSHTYRELRSDTPELELRALRQIYPTELKSADGEQLWLSRLSEDDPRISTEYEIAYARWIPGDPMQALRAVLIFVRPGDQLHGLPSTNV